MNLKNILISAGSAIFKNAVPGGDAILNVVNDLLPDDKKLPIHATGDEVKNAIDALPADQRASIMLKEFDVEIAEINNWSKIQASLSDADKAGASSRPFIARMMAWVVLFSVDFSVCDL